MAQHRLTGKDFLGSLSLVPTIVSSHIMGSKVEPSAMVNIMHSLYYTNTNSNGLNDLRNRQYNHGVWYNSQIQSFHQLSSSSSQKYLVPILVFLSCIQIYHRYLSSATSQPEILEAKQLLFFWYSLHALRLSLCWENIS